MVPASDGGDDFIWIGGPDEGLGSVVGFLEEAVDAACRSTIEWKTPRLRRRWASLAKKPSTALSQEAEVGVKMEDKAGVTIEPRANLGVLVGGVVVEDNVDDPAGRNVVSIVLRKRMNS